jgi:chromate transporter
MPAVGRFFLGFIPAVTAIILVAAWNMGKNAVRGVPEALIAIAAAGLLLGIGGFMITLGIVVAGALAGWLLFRRGNGPHDGGPSQTGHHASEKTAVQPGPDDRSRLRSIAAGTLAAAPWGLHAAMAGKLLMTFGGMSVLLFGGGYVFIPVIQRIVVDGYGWVSRQEFIDAIALGQVTPGPILISAAFIGYKVAGLTGAAAATIGIFTPPALVMILCTRFLDRIKGSEDIRAVLRGIRPAVIGMICAAAVTVGRTAPASGISLLIFSASLLALLRFRAETVWIIPGAGLAGLLLY